MRYRCRLGSGLLLMAVTWMASSRGLAQFVSYPDPVNDPLIVGLEGFSSKHGGWKDFNTHPRFLADVNGDGKADIVGFGDGGVFVSLASNTMTQGFRNIYDSDGATLQYKLVVNKRFNDPVAWINNHFSKSGGWTSQDNYPRMMGDVNGDGKADIVGCGKEAVYVSISTGSGFQEPVKWIGNYSQEVGGWSSFDAFPRALGDVNGDGKADLVGFGAGATLVSLSTGTSFAPGVEWIKNYARDAGDWSTYDKLPRTLADVNGDGRADVIGFGNVGVFVSLSTGSSFTPQAEWIRAFVESAGGWSSQRQYPRYVIDVNKDRKADIVALGEETVSVALSTGSGFSGSVIWSSRMTNLEGWASNQEMPRQIADYLGSGFPGLVGFSPDGVRIVPNLDGKGFEQLEPEREFAPKETYCWKDTYTRGAGTMGVSCSPGYEEWGGDCYPKCPPNMYGIGPLCWQNCPAGFSDIGVSCAKPKATSTAGFGWQIGDKAFDYDTGPRARCEAAYGTGKCYRSGLIWYPTCPANFHKVGDLVCSPDCPAGMRDDGAYCAKNTSPRGVGQGKNCGNGMVSDGGLCYPACNPSFDGAGPVCWGKCTGTYSYNCAAGCATNQTTCMANVGMMTVQTAGAASSLLSFVVGGPGISSAAKAAAKAGQQAAAKTVWKAGLNRLQGSWAGLAKNAARDAAIKEFPKVFLKNQVLNSRNLFFNMVSLAKFGTVQQLNQLVKESGQMKANGDVDLSALAAIDITGVTTAVLSFTKYSACGIEPITPSTPSIDLGNIGSNEGNQTVTIRVNKPTTFLHVGTAAYSNCSIVPTSTCVGRTLQPGESCTVSAKVATGGQRFLGELRLYTEDLDYIPYPIQVTANPNAGSECAVIPEVEEAANLTHLAGIWAWNNDLSKKVEIRADGSLVPVNGWAAPGTVASITPAQRTFLFKFGGAPGTGEVVTLARTNDILHGPNNTQTTKRHWDPRCPPGMEYLINTGSCYDVPVGKLMFHRPGTTPAVVFSDMCPAGFEDDPMGDRCRPKWTGKYIWGTPVTPQIVTDCSMKACPANFTKNACSCWAVDKTKPIQTATPYPAK